MPRRVLSAAARPFRALFDSDAFAGVLLIAVAILAVWAANSPLADAYHHLFHGDLAWSPVPRLYSLHAWINDALMAVFFFVVGLEVKREIVAGNLANANVRRLPVFAAAAGMAVPAVVYLLIAGTGPELQRGWAIPAATDIAFAMGVIGLLANRVPSALRVFLLTVAIVDDIGSVLIIATFYSEGIDFAWLLAAVLVLAGMIALNRRPVDRMWPYVIGGLALWYCVLHSGIHPTVAGVAAALTVPMYRRDGSGLLEDAEHALVGWNAYLIVPLFGFANAGVALSGKNLAALNDPLPLAVAAGLLIGKQVGVFGTVVIADKLDFARRPQGASWTQIWGVAVLCGIGFTMSLFIGALAFPNDPALVAESKLGVLCGSLASALLGYVILRLARPQEKG